MTRPDLETVRLFVRFVRANPQLLADDDAFPRAFRAYQLDAARQRRAAVLEDAARPVAL